MMYNCNCSTLCTTATTKNRMRVVRSGDGAGLLPVPVRATTLAYSREGVCCACSKCETGGLFFNFFILSILSSFSEASSRDTAGHTEILYSRPL